MEHLEIGDEIVFKVSVCGCKQRIHGVVKDFGCSKEDGMFYQVYVNNETDLLSVHEEDVEVDRAFYRENK
jgi:hypothetical protein